MFRIRLDIVNDLNSDDLLEVCGNPITNVIVRHELPHGNPHYHAFIETDIKDNTLRQRFKRKFPYLKSTDFSIKKCDPARVDEYVQYMFNTKKGNKWELINVSNFEEARLKNLIEAAKKVAEEYADSLTKPTIYQLAMEVRNRFTHKFGTSNNPVEQLGKRRELLPEGYEEFKNHLIIAIDVCRYYKQPYEEHFLRRITVTALGESYTGRQTIVNKIMNREFHYA